MFAITLMIVLVITKSSYGDRMWFTTDELENHISPEDLQEFLQMNNRTKPALENRYGDVETTTSLPVPEVVDCFGLGSFTQFLLNMRPDSSSDVNTQYYFSSRKRPKRVQVFPGKQFGLEWVDFNPKRKTVMIVHGFMSHSNASWVNEMTRAFLAWIEKMQGRTSDKWWYKVKKFTFNSSTLMMQRSFELIICCSRGDVNVIAVDWSKGGNTWKYWRAVANTRRVGSDVTGFLRQLIARTGARTKDFHFVGHSLGAHISSYVSFHLGKVARITGLDPAQPCFRTEDASERLDQTDADFVDIIHTNGRLFKRIGFGFPEPTGHADFYPNGGMKQPGCFNKTSLLSRLLPISPLKLQQAICSHGRAYLLFTESLINNNCTFKAHRWNLTYEGVNASLVGTCDKLASCAEMGITAVGSRRFSRARGPYFVLTTDKEPYCPIEWQSRRPVPELLRDLRHGFRLDRSLETTKASDADPELVMDVTTAKVVTEEPVSTTTKRSWWSWGR